MVYSGRRLPLDAPAGNPEGDGPLHRSLSLPDQLFGREAGQTFRVSGDVPGCRISSAIQLLYRIASPSLQELSERHLDLLKLSPSLSHLLVSVEVGGD
jgi:hypothetical protein